MDLGILALIFAAALLGPLLTLLSRGAIPAVVGTLLAGVILGRTGLRWVNPGKSDLSLLYTLGFATLMFTAGMGVPLRDIRVRSSLRTGVIAFLAAVPLALAAGYLTHAAGGGPTFVYAVVLASSSAAVALPVIDETGLSSPSVLGAIAWITIADVLATIAIPFVITPGRAGRGALGTLIIAALVVALFVARRYLRRIPQVRQIRREGKRRGWAIDLRVSVLVLVTLAFLAQKAGASILIAGFGTGLVVGAAGGPKRLSREVLGLGQGFLVPLFFVLLGARLDLRALASGHDAVLLALVLAALTVLVHVLASAAIHARPAIGLLASAQMGVPAAVISLGLSAHTIDQAQASAIFCAALASIGAMTVGAAILRRQQQAAPPILSPGEAAPAR